MKTNRRTHLLAAIDEALAAILNLETWITNSGPHDSARVKSFWIGWGIKFAIVDERGSIRAVGNSWQVEHLFDGEGNLTARARYVKLLRPGEKIIYGQQVVDDLYRKQCLGVA